MKPTRPWLVARLARLTTIVSAFVLIGCAHPASGAEQSGPLPVSIVAQTTFAPSLGVNLAKMTQYPSGLYVQDLTTGTGAVATTGRTVVVTYTGWLANGTQFDAGEISVTIGSHRTIAAWEEGLLGMRVGGHRRIVVPPNLGYGSRAVGNIPANSVLVFDMTVEQVL